MSISSNPTEGVPMTSLPARPRKIAPPHPGTMIAGILEEQHVPMRQAARAIGMSPTGLAKVLSGKSPVTAQTALRIGAYFGNGPEIWLNLQRDYDLWHARAELGPALEQIKPLEAR